MMISPVGSMLGYVDVAAGRQGAVLATLRRPLGSENEYPSDARPSGKPSYRSPEQRGWYGALFSRALPPGFHPTSIGARPTPVALTSALPEKLDAWVAKKTA
jgi:hypothetical protein